MLWWGEGGVYNGVGKCSGEGKGGVYNGGGKCSGEGSEGGLYNGGGKCSILKMFIYE